MRKGLLLRLLNLKASESKDGDFASTGSKAALRMQPEERTS